MVIQGAIAVVRRYKARSTKNKGKSEDKEEF